MQLTANAEALLTDLARQQGLPDLAFDPDGAIAVRLDGRTELAIGYSQANDTFGLVAVLGPGLGDGLSAWDAFQRNVALSERRTRIGLDGDSGALLLLRDVHVADLTFPAFSDILDQFASDLDALSADGRPSTVQGELEGVSPEAELLIFRL